MRRPMMRAGPESGDGLTGGNPETVKGRAESRTDSNNSTPTIGLVGVAARLPGRIERQLELAAPRGSTFVPALDRARLGRQLRAVLELMSDGSWRTLPEIAQHVVGAQTALSARLRDLRRAGFRVERRRRGSSTSGLFEYSLASEGSR